MKQWSWRVLVGLGAVAMLLTSATPASADHGEHGLGGSTNCAGPTKIGNPVLCTYTIRNNSDDFGDTMRAHAVELTAQSAGGSVPSGDVFGSLQWVFTPAPGNPGAPTCTGGSGLGTAISPYINATSCDIPNLARIGSLPFSFYTAQPADFALPGSILPMLARYTATDLCNGPGADNCPTEDLTVSPNSQTLIVKRVSATVTNIHDAAHQTVLTVPAGSTVHDSVSVTSADGGPVPTGNVTFDWFLNNTCTGAPAATSGPIALDASGQADAIGFPQGPLAPGLYGFLAHYAGSGTYDPSDGACEPLQVVDANIQITPNGVNRVGESHVFTAHVNVNDGTGSVSAPDGTQISFTIDSGPGGFTTANPCTTAGGTGSCSITLLSNATGVTTVSAHSTVSVGGISLTRDTNGVGANSGPATKTWVNARISIAPDATNEVGQPHTFTATLEKDTGTGSFVAAAGEHVDVLLTNSLGAGFVLNAGASTCDNAGANTNASGQCVMVFTSPTPGQVTGHASATLSVLDEVISVATNGVAPNSGNAVKTFVDAYIEITPPEATNPLNTTHTYTAHVFINAGLGGGYVPAPNGTLVTFTLLPGSVGSFTGGNTCLTAGGICTIDTTSANPGDDTMQASTTLTVGGVTMTRTTGQAAPGHANGPNAIKHWETEQLPCPAGLFKFRVAANGDLMIAYDQFPAPNDNSYGVNSVGWGTKVHTFGNLTGSDKAGIQIKDQNGVVRLSFNLDYLSSSGTGSPSPSGFTSLGPFGGDGGTLVGTLSPVWGTDIAWDTSLSRNLNGVRTGQTTYGPMTYFAGGVQTIGKPASGTGASTVCPVGVQNCANLLFDSPPTVDKISDYTLKVPNPWNATYTNPEYDPADPSPQIVKTVNGWNFHNTYFATIRAAKLASLGFNANTWTVQPNLTVLHNSPAKPCPTVAGPALSVTKRELKDNQAKITILNDGAADEFIDNIKLSWPVGTNGALTQIKLDGDVLWTGSNSSGSIDFSKALAAPGGTGNTLVFDANKRKISHGSSDVLLFVFVNKPIAALTVANYPVSSAHFESGTTLSPLMNP